MRGPRLARRAGGCRPEWGRPDRVAPRDRPAEVRPVVWAEHHLGQVVGGARGQATDIEIHARDILKTRDQLNRILAANTGQTVEKIERDTERDYFMFADEAKAYGVVDQVISKRP